MVAEASSVVEREEAPKAVAIEVGMTVVASVVVRAVGTEAGMVVAVMVEAALWEEETMVEVLMVASMVALMVEA